MRFEYSVGISATNFVDLQKVETWKQIQLLYQIAQCFFCTSWQQRPTYVFQRPEKKKVWAPTQPIHGRIAAKSELGVKGRWMLNRAPDILVSKPAWKPHKLHQVFWGVHWPKSFLSGDIHNLELKLSRSVGMFSKIKNYLCNNALRSVFYSLAYSHLQYEIGVGVELKKQLLTD